MSRLFIAFEKKNPSRTLRIPSLCELTSKEMSYLSLIEWPGVVKLFETAVS